MRGANQFNKVGCKLQIVKDDGADLSAYTTLLSQIDGLKASDYTETSWTNLQTALSDNKISDENSQEEINAAVSSIQDVLDLLESLVTSTVYDAAGTYGPESGSQTIDSDVIITASGVVLQNLEISGNLIIDKGVGDGDVTLNNVTVSGELRIRGGGENSIHINGGQYPNISVEMTPTGKIRIVTTDLSGAVVVIGEVAAGEEVILEGAFDQVTVSAPGAIVTTRGNTKINSLDLRQAAANATVNLGSNSTIAKLTVGGNNANINGSGTVQNADVESDSAVFEKAPVSYTVADSVNIPPVMPSPDNGGGGGGGGGVSKISLAVTTPPTVTPTKNYNGNKATDVTAAAVDAANVTGIVAGDDVTVLATATYDNKNAGDNKTITVSYTLSGANASKYSAPASATISTNGSITPKQLTAPVAPSVSKEYDGTVTAADKTISDDLGQFAGDTVVITQSATYQNSPGNSDAEDAGTGKTVTFSYSLSGSDAGNYQAPADQTGTGTITKKTLDLTWDNTFKSNFGVVQTTKTYDGSSSVSYNGAGSVSGDVISSITNRNFNTGIETILVTASAAYSDVNAGDNKTITISYTIGSDSAKNYQIADENIPGATIEKRQLTIADANVPVPVAKAYDGTTDVFTATNNSGKIYNLSVSPANVITADASNVSVKASASYPNKNAGTNKIITITYTLSGSAAGNYEKPADISKTADITPLPLALGSINSVSRTKDYDGSSSGQLSIGISCPANSLLFSSDVNTEHTLVISTASKYYTDSNCTSETSQPGTNLGLNYTISLSGAAAGNYVFDNNTQSISGKTGYGTINAMPLTINTDFIQTEKTYDGTPRVYSNDATPVEISDYSVDSSKITGLVNGESVDVKVTASYADMNAAENKTINLTYVLGGNDASHYTLTTNDSINTGKINPIQLLYTATPFADNAGSKVYDGTTIVRYNGDDYNQYNKNSAGTELKNCVTGLLDADKANISVLTTATFADKNAGNDKLVTFTYTLTGTAAGNYLAPVPNESSGIRATITRRMLYYSNPNIETLKKYDGSSAALVKTISLDSTKSHGVDTGVVNKTPSTLEDVALSCTAAYYTGGQEATAVGTNYEIRLNPTLTGTDAANYQMTSYTTIGSILAENALITARYANGSWSDWGQIYGSYQTLSPPNNDSGFKLFMYNGTSTFYGLSSDGRVYQATASPTTTEIGGFSLYNGGSYTGQNLPLSENGMTYQVFGVDTTGQVLAVALNPNDYNNYYLYYWNGSAWADGGQISLSDPINPTYYEDGTYDYIIYQDTGGTIYKKNISTNDSAVSIGSSVSPPSAFSRQMIYYDGSNPVLFAY
ncbi:MAG: hypothetical protein PWP62_389 [Eubacteriaceae bacterium]|nr:hypothetical protein [Eubacteriaceae bacterium]